MHIDVTTARTKAQDNLLLLTQTQISPQGENIALVLDAVAQPDQQKILKTECVRIVTQGIQHADGDASVRLDGTLKELNGLLKGFTLAGTVGDVNAVIALVEPDGMVHVSHAGSAEAYVVRKGVASQITEYAKGKPKPEFINITSGDLHPGDIVICSSTRLLRATTPSQLAQLCQQGTSSAAALATALEDQGESAALAGIFVEFVAAKTVPTAAPRAASARVSRGVWKRTVSALGPVGSFLQRSVTRLVPFVQSVSSRVSKLVLKIAKDLRDPARKKRAHLLILAGIIGGFLILLLIVRIFVWGQQGQSKKEFQEFEASVYRQLDIARDHFSNSDLASANVVLTAAEESVMELLNSDTVTYRDETRQLLSAVNAANEEINNIIRVPANESADVSTRRSDIVASGFVGLGDGEFIVYDKENIYNILLNSVDEPKRLGEPDLIADATNLPRLGSVVFQMNDNGVLELNNGSTVSMKTDDITGWKSGVDIEGYLRFLYILQPDEGDLGQIYKYERLQGNYGVPSPYNVNGDLRDSIDMAIDGNIYVLKKGGEIIKLLRGEKQPFSVRYIPGEGDLAGVSKIYKVVDGYFYLLDPERNRVIVTTDGGDSGESAYIKQYILEGDQVDTLTDLYVTEDESRLYVLDSKRIYAIDL